MASRDQLEDWTQRWLQANRDAEAAGDWKPLADFYTEDATYGWNYGPEVDFMTEPFADIDTWRAWYGGDTNHLAQVYGGPAAFMSNAKARTMGAPGRGGA